jgi:CheY-like chemotaxis protein
MLQNLSEKMRACYERAEDCACRAKTAPSEELRADYLRSERCWLRLARSYELQQRLTLFINENNRRKTMETRDIGHVDTDDPPAGVAGFRAPWLGKTDNDPQRRQNELIAIVDDDEDARLGMSILIESLGSRTATFASAEEYLASDMVGSVTCLILDVHLPGMSGPDLQAHLMAEGHRLPTVFVTGRFEEQVRKRVTEAGALGYLRKPCYEKALINCIEKAISKLRSESN